MYAIDTNVLVRLFVNDDQQQHNQAKKLFQGLKQNEQVYICSVVTVELVWVLESVYGFQREAIAQTITYLLQVEQVSLENSIAFYQANKLYRDGADFADAMISTLAASAGCSATLTFDKSAVKKAGMTMLNCS
jgi:predicted nucleic-acid-binding protein